MTTNLDKVTAVQTRISALSARVTTVLQHANSSEWPYSALTAEVRLFAHEMAETANSMLSRAAHSVGVTVHDCDGPLSAERTAFISKRFEALSAAKNSSVEALSSASFASADCFLDLANTLLNRAEQCIDGYETIYGTKISRGPLWEK
ncbi:MAG TPA: hypothetical protein V6C81_13125 [Planktothrix sp.]